MLTLPAFSFSFESDNLTGIPPATGVAVGTSFTPGSSNVEGTPVTVLSALAQDCNYLVVGFSNTTAVGANVQVLADILVDRAGSTNWSNFIDNLVCGFLQTQSALAGIAQWYHFPIWIPAGASIGVQAQQRSATAVTSKIVMYAFGQPNRPEMWWCGQKVESLGILSSISQGTNVTPTSSGTYSAWHTIGTASANYGSVQFGVNGSDGSASANNYFWQIGVSSEKLPGSPTFYRTVTNAETGITISGWPIWCNVPSGVTWQLRATGSSGGTIETWNAAIYGVF